MIKRRQRLWTIEKLLLAMAAVLLASAPAAAKPGQRGALDTALLNYMRTHLSPQGRDREAQASTATRLRIGWVDLNGDGAPEALVYLSGAELCGSGGCQLLVLQQANGTFHERGRSTVTRLPVAVLDHRTSGWRDITVLAAGGAAVPGYRAVLPFDGRRYAPNPTILPAHRLAAGAAERVVIGDDVYPFLGTKSGGP